MLNGNATAEESTTLGGVVVSTTDDKKNKHEKGDGSHYFRKSDQRWCATLTLPSYDGKRRRVTRALPRGSTERQAIAKLTELRREREKTGDIPTDRVTVAQWLNIWFTTIARKKIRPKTAATYRTCIEQYIIPAIGSLRLSKLTPAHVRRVEEYVTSKPKDPKRPELGNLSSTTAMQAHRILAVALKYAEREGRVTRNVATLTDAPRKAARRLTVLTPVHGVKVLEAVTSARLGSRWAAALLTGARQGEILGIELDRVGNDLDLSWQLQRLSWMHGCADSCGRKRGSDCPKRTLDAPADWEHRHLTGGLWLSRPKSSAGWRIIPLVDPLRSIIERRIAVASTEPNPHGLLWTAERKMSKDHKTLLELDGSPIDPSQDNHAWHAVLKIADVPDARLHDARHTTASLLRKAGVPIGTITKIMGHSTEAMSEQYIDYDREQLMEALTSMSILVSGKN